MASAVKLSLMTCSSQIHCGRAHRLGIPCSNRCFHVHMVGSTNDGQPAGHGRHHFLRIDMGRGCPCFFDGCRGASRPHHEASTNTDLECIPHRHLHGCCDRCNGGQGVGLRNRDGCDVTGWRWMALAMFVGVASVVCPAGFDAAHHPGLGGFGQR